MGAKEPMTNVMVTHSICPQCLLDVDVHRASQSLGEYLDRFTEPVMVVDVATRVVAANQAMSQRLGRHSRTLLGLQGGAAMLCRYASLPEGCGNTVHCRDCSIRRLVEDSLCNRSGSVPTPALLHHGDQDISLMVSCHYVDSSHGAPLVVVRLEPAGPTPTRAIC